MILDIIGVILAVCVIGPALICIAEKLEVLPTKVGTLIFNVLFIVIGVAMGIALLFL